MAKINGKMLRDVRTHKNLTLAKLAEMSCLKTITIMRIEAKKGPCSCHSHTLSQLSHALGLEPDDLGEDSFERIVDISGGLELHVPKYASGDEFIEASRKIAGLIDIRTRILRQ